MAEGGFTFQLQHVIPERFSRSLIALTPARDGGVGPELMVMGELRAVVEGDPSVAVGQAGRQKLGHVAGDGSGGSIGDLTAEMGL